MQKNIKYAIEALSGTRYFKPRRFLKYSMEADDTNGQTNIFPHPTEIPSPA